MSWEVEYTDEFEKWWLSLTEEEQISVDATVQLLEERGPQLPFRTAVASRAQSIVICGRFLLSMKAAHTERFMPLTHEEQQFCS